MPPKGADGKQAGSNASALKRLKESLKGAGLIGPAARTQQGKRKQRQQREQHPGSSAAEASARFDRKKKLAQLEKALNPFEAKAGRQKHEVVGRKTKGVDGRPGATRQTGMEKRRQTLLVEMKSRSKSGGFVDRRFGENDPALSLEDKMLERFTKERQRQSRGGGGGKRGGSVFNLEGGGDGDNDDDALMGLTHMGRSLADMDEFDDYGLGGDDGEGIGAKGAIDRETVSHLHFGGFEPVAGDANSDAPRSRAEIMKEVIAKSKFHKHERQMEKEEDETLRRKLDDDFSDIRSLLFAPNAIESGNRRSLPSQTALFGKAQDQGDARKDEEDEEEEEGAEDEDENQKQAEKEGRDRDYDMLVHDLARDKRAHATDRTKTEAELAQEEKEKLERAERHRKRRMAGEDSDTEDERESAAAKKRRKGQAPQGDDLEDDFVVDSALNDPTGFGVGLGQAMSSDEEEEEDDDEDEEEESGDEDDDEDDDDEDEDDDSDSGEEDGSDLDEDDEIESAEQLIAMVNAERERRKQQQPTSTGDDSSSKSKSVKVTSEASATEIPYTFTAPSNHAEFLRIVHRYNAEQQVIVVQRLRALHHIGLDAGNREKLETLLSVLLEHVHYCGSQRAPQTAVVQAIFPHLHALATQFPEVATEKARSMLATWHAELATKMSKTSGSALPDSGQLLSLVVLMRLFPTSDLIHAVVTPALLYIGQCLGQAPVRGGHDILSGLFLCQLYLESQQLSKRIMPEMFAFLYHTLWALTPHTGKQAASSPPGDFPTARTWPADLALPTVASVYKNITPERLTLSRLANAEDSATLTLAEKVSALHVILQVVRSCAVQKSGTSAFAELFRPAVDLLTPLAVLPLPEAVQERATATLEQLNRMIKLNTQSRKPLQLQRHKPVAIASLLPKFEDNYSLDKHYDPDRERAESQRLRALHRKERKGAMRELRRDNQFIATERAREQKEKDEAYKRKIRHITGLLTQEQGEKNKLERMASRR